MILEGITLPTDKEILRGFSILLRMPREGHKRICLELKKRHWKHVALVIRVLKKYGIDHKQNMVLEHKPYPYYRHRVYVYGEEVLKVLDIIEWDFQDTNKNRKLIAIRGIYQNEFSRI